MPHEMERACMVCGHTAQEHRAGTLGCMNDWDTPGPGCRCSSWEANFPEMVEAAG